MSEKIDGLGEQENAEANLFARCLLMPEKFLRRDVTEPLDVCEDARIEKLAKRYQVTEQMMIIRLCELKLL